MGQVTVRVARGASNVCGHNVLPLLYGQTTTPGSTWSRLLPPSPGWR